MGLDGGNKIAVTAEDFVGNNLFNRVHLFDFSGCVWVIWYRQDFFYPFMNYAIFLSLRMYA